MAILVNRPGLPARALSTDASGSLLPLVAFGMAAFVAAGALAIDVGNLYVNQTRLQQVADAAVLSAVGLLPNATAARTEALRLAEANMPNARFGAVLRAADVVPGRWDGATRVFTAGGSPADALRITTRRETATGNPVAALFASALGTDSFDVRATATAVMGAPPVCLLALDPSAAGSVFLNSDSEIVAPSCTVVVNSTASDAIRTNSRSRVKSARTCVKGRHAGSGYDPTPENGCTAMADPLASLPRPTSTGTCNHRDLNIDGVTRTLDPGLYCDKVTLNNNARVTLRPGTYVFRDGEITLNSGARLTGDGVTLYMTGSGTRLKVNSGSHIDLSAPTTGAYAGVLVYEDRTVETGREHLVNSDSTSVYEGTLYLPRGRLVVNSNSSISGASPLTAIIARQIYLNSFGKLELNVNTGSTSVPLPAGLRGSRVRLAS